jgi:translation elongation factor EF-4
VSAKKNINVQEVFLTIAKKIPLVNKEPNNENKKV